MVHFGFIFDLGNGGLTKLQGLLTPWFNTFSHMHYIFLTRWSYHVIQHLKISAQSFYSSCLWLWNYHHINVKKSLQRALHLKQQIKCCGGCWGVDLTFCHYVRLFFFFIYHAFIFTPTDTCMHYPGTSDSDSVTSAVIYMSNHTHLKIFLFFFLHICLCFPATLQYLHTF